MYDGQSRCSRTSGRGGKISNGHRPNGPLSFQTFGGVGERKTHGKQTDDEECTVGF